MEKVPVGNRVGNRISMITFQDDDSEIVDPNDDVGVKGHVISNRQTFTSRLIASCKVHHIPEHVEVHEVLT